MNDLDFKITVIKKLEHIETKIDNYDKIVSETNENSNKTKEHEKRLNEIESQRKWYFTTIVGCIIGIIITAIKNLLKIN